MEWWCWRWGSGVAHTFLGASHLDAQLQSHLEEFGSQGGQGKAWLLLHGALHPSAHHLLSQIPPLPARGEGRVPPGLRETLGTHSVISVKCAILWYLSHRSSYWWLASFALPVRLLVSLCSAQWGMQPWPEDP